MFEFIRRWSQRHWIDRDRVHCPIRARDVDVETCIACCWPREIERDAAQPFVRCRPGFAADEAAFIRQP